MVQVSTFSYKFPPFLHAGLSSGAESLQLQQLLNVGICFGVNVCPVLLPDMPAQRLPTSVLHAFDMSSPGYLAPPQTDANRCCLFFVFFLSFLSALGVDGVVLICSKGHLIALDIIRGLVFLHSNKVVHADLKAKNVLLTQNAGKPDLLQLDI